jgi:type IV pilus biogenesis protein CpaD/CtpE
VSAKAKPPKLLDLLQRELASPARPRFRWFADLPADVQADFLEAKRLWRDGTYKVTANRMATNLVAAAKQMGIDPLPSRTAAADWLKD